MRLAVVTGWCYLLVDWSGLTYAMLLDPAGQPRLHTDLETIIFVSFDSGRLSQTLALRAYRIALVIVSIPWVA